LNPIAFLGMAIGRSPMQVVQIPSGACS